MRALVVGPGMGRDERASSLLHALLREHSVPMVLDADALFHVAALGLGVLRDAKSTLVLTPHPQEAARLLGMETGDVQRDRFAAARALAEGTGHVVVLKGALTIITAPGAPLLVCPFGTPALGVAGTGDVLAGVLGTVLAMTDIADAHVSALVAKVAAGVVLHALAGEHAAVTDRGLFAGEVADAIPHVLALAP
jgi:hydroxyethylthiazole kinase-like uncharacterized protein yjeF